MLNTGVLDMEIQGSQETVDKVLCFASEMILAIVNHEVCSSVSINNKGVKTLFTLKPQINSKLPGV